MKKRLFLDMDGTLAMFNSKRNALKRFDNEKGFFSSLKPFVNINVINEMIKKEMLKSMLFQQVQMNKQILIK